MKYYRYGTQLYKFDGLDIYEWNSYSNYWRILDSGWLSLIQKYTEITEADAMLEML